MKEKLEELRAITMRARNERTETGIPRVAMVRGMVPPEKLAGVYEPMMNFILQGSKTLTIGEDVFRFGPESYFVISVDAPATGKIWEESVKKPYLAVNLTLDTKIISEMLSAHSDKEFNDPQSEKAFSVCPITDELIDAWLRMMRLIDRPTEISVLSPLIEKEILFRLLQGPQGWMLRQIANRDSYLAQIRKVIGWIKANLNESFQVEDLADMAGLSVSAFHRHFKSTTSLSPVQYQKQLRLLEARSKLVSEGQSAASVALDIGYESVSQFSREYTRMFGLSPIRDAIKIRAMIEPSSKS